MKAIIIIGLVIAALLPAKGADIVVGGLQIRCYVPTYDTTQAIILPISIFRTDTHTAVYPTQIRKFVVTLYNSLDWKIREITNYTSYYIPNQYIVNAAFLPQDTYTVKIYIEALIETAIFSGSYETTFQVRETKSVFDKINEQLEILKDFAQQHNTTFLTESAYQLQNLSTELRKLVAEFQTALTALLKSNDPGYNITLVICANYRAPDLTILDDAGIPYQIHHNITFTWNGTHITFLNGSANELWDMLYDVNYTSGNVIIANTPFIPINESFFYNPPDMYYNVSAGDTPSIAHTRAFTFFTKTKSTTLILGAGLTKLQFLIYSAVYYNTSLVPFNYSTLISFLCNNTVFYTLDPGNYSDQGYQLIEYLTNNTAPRTVSVPNSTWSEYPVHVEAFQNYIEFYGRAVWLLFDGASAIAVDNTYFQTSITLFAPYVWAYIAVKDKAQAFERAYEETGNFTYLELKDQILDALDNMDFETINTLLNYEYFDENRTLEVMESMNKTLEVMEGNSSYYATYSTGSETYGKPMCISDTARRIIDDINFTLTTILNTIRALINAKKTIKQMILNPFAFSWDAVININKLFHDLANSIANSFKITGDWKIHVDGFDFWIGPFHVQWGGFDLDLNWLRDALNAVIHACIYSAINNPLAVGARSLLTFVGALIGAVLLQSVFEYTLQFADTVSQAFASLIQMFSDVFMILSEVLSTVSNTILNISLTLDNVYATLKDLTLTMIDDFASLFNVVSEKVKSLSTFFENISGFVASAMDISNFLGRGSSLLQQISQALNLHVDVQQNILNSYTAFTYITHIQNTFAGSQIFFFEEPESIEIYFADPYGNIIPADGNVTISYDTGNKTISFSNKEHITVQKHSIVTIFVMTNKNSSMYITANSTAKEYVAPAYKVSYFIKNTAQNTWQLSFNISCITNATPHTIFITVKIVQNDIVLTEKLKDFAISGLETISFTITITLPPYIITSGPAEIVITINDEIAGTESIELSYTWYGILFWVLLIIAIISIGYSVYLHFKVRKK